MLMRRFAITGLAALGTVALSSCLVTHRQAPAAMVVSATPSKAYSKLYFHVDDQVLGKSRLALIQAMREKSPFEESETADQAPAQGVFVEVRIKTVPETRTAQTYRALSYATLTVLPSWSGRGGADLLYEVYLDGRKMKNFDYQIRRKEMTWLPLLPFVWANHFMRNEGEAYEDTALQFFDDADSLFRTASTPAP
jgi:hypothetical protein